MKLAPPLEVWSDLHCPYAYLALFRLRRALEDRPGVEVLHRCLAIELSDEKVTPKPILDAEAPLIFLDEPEIPYRPWTAPDAEWPVTMWPAFEAVKCAQRQGLAAAHELDWELRKAFWSESECISMRHVILRVAARVQGLDMARLEKDWDAGLAKQEVVDESRHGWHKLELEVSPTFVLPDRTRIANPAGPRVEVDAEQGHKVVVHTRTKGDARETFRDMVRRCG